MFQVKNHHFVIPFKAFREAKRETQWGFSFLVPSVSESKSSMCMYMYTYMYVCVCVCGVEPIKSVAASFCQTSLIWKSDITAYWQWWRGTQLAKSNYRLTRQPHERVCRWGQVCRVMLAAQGQTAGTGQRSLFTHRFLLQQCFFSSHQDESDLNIFIVTTIVCLCFFLLHVESRNYKSWFKQLNCSTEAK